MSDYAELIERLRGSNTRESSHELQCRCFEAADALDAAQDRYWSMMDKLEGARETAEAERRICDELRAENERLLQSVSGLLEETGQWRNDAITLAMRLYAVDETTFSPETYDVMTRLRPVVAKILGAA